MLGKVFTVAFFGHRYLDKPLLIKERLDSIIKKLINEKEYLDILVGRNGDFDQLVSSSVCEIKKTYRDDNTALVLVLPYLMSEYSHNINSFEEYYDEIEISETAANTHFLAAIQARNREMVDRADLIVCFIEHNSGGAYQTMRYAQKQNKKILNLAERGIGDVYI